MDVIQSHCLLLKSRLNLTLHLRHAWQSQGGCLLLAGRGQAGGDSRAAGLSKALPVLPQTSPSSPQPHPNDPQQHEGLRMMIQLQAGNRNTQHNWKLR